MARQNMYPSPWEKKLHTYANFFDGMNSRSANESLLDTELPYLNNADIIQRGVIARRHGMKMLEDYSHLPGKTQGHFRYYTNTNEHVDIVAKGGYLYINGQVQDIEGFDGQLQTEREMNAVQDKGLLYIATGSKLVEFDGTLFKVVTPHTPVPLEALYVGLNGLADDPQDYIRNGTSLNVSLEGIKSKNRYGVVNEMMEFEVFYSAPPGAELEFRWERRLTTHETDYWMIGKDWSSDPFYHFYTDWVGNMQMKVLVRDKNTDAIYDSYFLPQYLIHAEPGEYNEGIYSPTIHQCNQIFVYWDRLYLYGDPVEKDVIYASDVQNFSYFPITNTLRFENVKREGITKITRFRDSLIVFTDSTIQRLDGKIPSQWSRLMINSGVGCIAPKTVQPIENRLVFLSKEGLYALKTDTFKENNMNVERIDENVEKYTKLNQQNAVSIVFDSQYQLVFPDLKRRMRYYYKQTAWTHDNSVHMDLVNLMSHYGILIGQKSDGTLIEFDKSTYQDLDVPFDTVIETKGFSFGEPYHPKKMKEAQIIVEDQPTETNINVVGFTDEKQVVNLDLPIKATVGINYKENMTDIHKLRMTGRGNNSKIVITHSENKPFYFVGLGFIFKVKKP